MASNKLYSQLIKEARADGLVQEGDGVLAPKAGIFVQGVYRDFIDGELVGETPNLITAEGMNYLLNAGCRGATQKTQWYMALFSGTTAPAESLTAADFASTQSEITSATEGYTEAARPEWITVDSDNKELTNAASVASFTVATATTLTVRGVGILSTSAKGATTGTLLSAAAYQTPRTLNNGVAYDVTYLLRMSN
jgi:hypothetical protein